MYISSFSNITETALKAEEEDEEGEGEEGEASDKEGETTEAETKAEGEGDNSHLYTPANTVLYSQLPPLLTSC